MNFTKLQTRIWIAVGLLALVAVPIASAQTKTMRANIPFQFTVGEKSLPAGTYYVEVASASNRVQLRDADGTLTLYMLAQTGPRTRAAEQGQLVFHRYGSSHFLRSVNGFGETTAYQLPASKIERELAKATGRVEVAWVPVQ